MLIQAKDAIRSAPRNSGDGRAFADNYHPALNPAVPGHTRTVPFEVGQGVAVDERRQVGLVRVAGG